MLKILSSLVTDPLGLPIDPLWEYAILAVVGWVAHEIAWSASPGGRWGSLAYWVTKVFVYIVIWAMLYAVIYVGRFIIAQWVYFAIGAGLILCGIGIYTYRKKRL